jgi:hypothetical protein
MKPSASPEPTRLCLRRNQGQIVGYTATPDSIAPCLWQGVAPAATRGRRFAFKVKPALLVP